MGQLFTMDKIPQLPVSIPEDNVKIPQKIQNFHICQFLSYRAYQRIFYFQTSDEIQAVYRFGIRFTVYLQLKKQKTKKLPGIYIQLADEYVYAYKHKKLDKSQKIKPQKILFKKRIIKKEILLSKFAQTKFLSLLEIGPQLGRVYNGLDGIITENYIEYFSEIAIQKIQQCIPKNSQLQILQKKLNNLKLDGKSLTNVSNIHNLAYSQRRKGYIFKLTHYNQKLNPQQQSNIQLSYQNKSIHYIVRMFQTQITQVIMDLDNEARMLPYINNLIFQNQYDKVLIKIEENLNMIEAENQKLSYVDEINTMIQKHTHAKIHSQYQSKIQQILTQSVTSSLLKSSMQSVTVSALKSSNSLTLSHVALTKQTKSLKQLTSTNQLSYQTEIKLKNTTHSNSKSKRSIKLSPFKKHKKLKASNSQQFIEIQTELVTATKNNQAQRYNNTKQLSSLPSSSRLIQQQKLEQKQSNVIVVENQNKFKLSLTSQQKQQIFIKLQKSLKQSILQKKKQKTWETLQQLLCLQLKPALQIHLLYSKQLIQAGRSLPALSLLQHLTHFSPSCPQPQLYHYYQICLLHGILLYQRYQYKKSLKSFQRSLSILLKLKHYSIKMLIVYNNIACVYYFMKQYDKAVLNVHRGFRLGEYSPDYQYLMRSNMAMVLIQKNMLKQAKIEIMKVNKIVQPVNDMVIFCKFYSNLAYIELLETPDIKIVEKAMVNFQEACIIEEKYLIPNGYRPSVFLHNNMAMLYYRRKQYKKAKYHCQKIFDVLNQIQQKLIAIQVHFNIGKVFSYGYNYDIPLKHFQQAWVLLQKVQQNQGKKFIILKIIKKQKSIRKQLENKFKIFKK